MLITTAFTAGLVIWIVLWSIGVKPLDAFLVTLVVGLLGVGAKMLLDHVPGSRRT